MCQCLNLSPLCSCGGAGKPGSKGGCEWHIFDVYSQGTAPNFRFVFVTLQPEGKAAAQGVGLTAAEADAALGLALPVVACNDAELADARWFPRPWLSAALAGAGFAQWCLCLAAAPCRGVIGASQCRTPRAWLAVDLRGAGSLL